MKDIHDIDSISLSCSSDKTPVKIKCTSKEHDKKPYLREGNRVIAVVTKDSGEWSVKDTTCLCCSAIDMFEHAESKDFAVVEGTLKSADGGCRIDNLYIWERIRQ